MVLKTWKNKLVALFMTLAVALGVVALSPSAIDASAAGTQRTQSSFIASKNGVQVTENYSHATLDSGKSGVLIESTSTGTAANGASVAFADPMSGVLSLDYRVFSTRDYAGSANPSASGADWGTEALHAFCDLRELAFTVTDTISGKSFTIIQEGGAKYSLTSTMFSVKTGTMADSVGYKYTDWNYAQAPTVNLWGYKTIAYGTSFCNKGLSGMGGFAADGGYSSVIEFNPENMKVYAWGRTPSQGYVKVEIIDLSNPALVGDANVLSSNDFTKYTVSVTFNKVMRNDYTDSDITTAYDRTARMIVYSLNGQTLAGTNDGNGNYVVNDNVGSIGLLTPSTLDMCAGEAFSFAITSYDVIDGYGTYTEDIFYSTDYAPEQKTLTYASGYVLNLEKFGTLTVTVPGGTDSNGNVGTSRTYTYRVRDEYLPEMEFNSTANLQTKFDIEGIKNSLCRPTVSKSDITILSDSRKTYTVSVSVRTPKGILHTTTINSLPYLDFGTYRVTYNVVDEFGNASSIYREFEVGDFKAPEILIRSEEITAYKGDRVSLDPLSIVDNYATSLDYTCSVYKDGQLVASQVQSFTPDQTGEYTVVYTAWDESGNTVERQIKLTVAEGITQTQDQPTDYTTYIVIAVAASVLIIGAWVAVAIITKQDKE